MGPDDSNEDPVIDGGQTEVGDYEVTNDEEDADDKKPSRYKKEKISDDYNDAFATEEEDDREDEDEEDEDEGDDGEDEDEDEEDDGDDEEGDEEEEEEESSSDEGQDYEGEEDYEESMDSVSSILNELENELREMDMDESS